MITNITLENFKCFRQVSINPKRLTVLIGPNGTGKSSILQALLLLKQSVGEEILQFQGRQINFPDRLEPSIPPNFLSERSISKIIVGGDSGGEDSDVSYLYGTTFSQHGNVIANFGKLRSELEKAAVEVKIDESDATATAIMDIGDASITLTRSRKVGEITSQNRLSSPGAGGTLTRDTLIKAIGMLSIVSSDLTGIKSVPSVRGLVRPSYELGLDFLPDVTLSEGLSAQEEQTATKLAYSRAIEGKLSKLMEQVTGTGLQASPVPPRHVEVGSLSPSGPVNIVAEGFGANALVLLLLQLVTADKGATILIEEPEIHLHPKAQADLAEVLAETANAEDKQIIMTTHSEHLVERLLLLVAEGTLTADDVAIYSFSKDAKGECFATEIQVLENGQVEGGLTDFYANNLETLDRRVKALKQSR